MENHPSPIPPAPRTGQHSHAVPIPAAPIDTPRSMLSAWQLNAQQEEDNDLRNILSIIRRRGLMITSVAAVVMALMTGQALNQEEIYEGQFRVLVEPVNADDDISDITSVLGQEGVGNSALDYETQVQVLRSPELIEPVAQQLSQTYPDIDYLTLLENLRIQRLGETKILEIRYSGTDPVQIQTVLDQLSNAYLKYSLEERQTNLRQGINFVENQLPELQTQVDTVQDQLQRFRLEYSFINPDIQADQISKQTSRLEEQRLNLDRQLAEAQQSLLNLDTHSGTIGALDSAPVYQQLLSELRAVETKMAAELTRFSPDSLTIRVLEEQRNNIVPLMQQEAERVVGTQQALAVNRYQTTAIQSATLADAEAAVQSSLAQLPALIRQYTDLQRELEISTEALTRFRVTRENLEIEAAQTEIPWQLIEAPLLPAQPISPNLKRSLLVGLITSILAGLVAALILEKLDNVYHSVDELKAGAKLPILGTLPFNRQLRDSRTPAASLVSQLTGSLPKLRRSWGGYYGYAGNGESSFMEALRVLHTNIRLLSGDHHIRSIIVSSALPGDGKSTVCANLAQVATAMGQRVLVVDVDLRKPQVHERLGVSNDIGLSNLISDDLPLKSAIQQIAAPSQHTAASPSASQLPAPQLFVLTAGNIPPDPTKLLASRKMQQLMDTFERCFDLVIYDAPPTMGLADVSLIGQRTDGLVLISRMGKTDRTILAQSIETLKLAQIPILGIVANGVKADRYSAYSYYSYPPRTPQSVSPSQLNPTSQTSSPVASSTTKPDGPIF